MKFLNLSTAFLIFVLCSVTTLAQTTAFSYQGRLSEMGAPVTGVRYFRFTLFDENGAAIPDATVDQTLTVTNGVFSTSLDFGAGAFVSGASRSLKISVKINAGDAYTDLNPRQEILAAPYSIKSKRADDAAKLGGVDSARFVQQDAGGNVAIAGNFTVGGSLSLNTVNAQTQYNLGGQRILGGNGGNLFVGILAGQSNTTGNLNSFFGNAAGASNTIGASNSFFGTNAGYSNVNGLGNTFVGNFAGFSTQSTGLNTFVGFRTGYNNIASSNAFFGAYSGEANTTGTNNTFVGTSSGAANTTGSENSFFGREAGRNNTASANSFFGSLAGYANTSGTNNTFVGVAAGENNTTADFNTFVGTNAGFANQTGAENTFVGKDAGFTNSTGSLNSFFGRGAGKSNTSGDSNAFFGINAGILNTNGNFNSFFGNNAGYNNTSGTANNFFGGSAGGENTTGSSNSFFGDRAGNYGIGNGFTTGIGNTFIGVVSGKSIISGSYNTMLGGNTSGTANINFATAVGAYASVTQSNSIVLGAINGINGATADTNVGIGTTAPTTRFQIKTVSGNYGFTHTDGAITVGSYVGGSSSGATGGWLGTQSNNKLFFFINNGQPSMTVDTTGNVGIGTTAPTSKLTVAGLIETSSGGVKFPDGTVQTTASGGSSVTSLNGLTGNVTLAAGSNITITPTGNTLTIASTGGILNQTTPQTGANFNIDGNGTIGGTLTANKVQAANDSFVLGNFGIGTSAPRAKLDVTGGNILIDTAGSGIILKSPDGNTCRLLTISDAGAVTLTPIACP